MVYKKYITKNGKVYGPYSYHSRRENGHVVSEYHGKKTIIPSKKFFLIVAFSLLAFILVYFAFSFFNNGSVSGNVIADLETSYNSNESLDGLLAITLNQGELIPADSIVVIETSLSEESYSLSELISDDVVEGDYYLEGTSVSGFGEGYGIPGEKKVSVPVYFTLLISQSSEETNETIEDETDVENNETIEEPEVIEETPIETNETENSETEVENNETQLENEETEVENNETIEEPVVIEETPVDEEVSEESSEIVVSEETKDETEEVEKEQKNDNSDKKEVKNEKAEAKSNNASPLTGNIVSKLFGGVFNFFQGITGRATFEIVNEIDGEVSLNDSFEYTLEDGQTASVKSGSVRTSEGNISDDSLDLVIDGNEVSITTDYSSSEEGFGENYVSSDTKKILINISELGVVSNGGLVTVRLVYESEEIISLNVNLSSEGEIAKVTNQTILNETELNETEIEETLFLNLSDSLSSEEKEILEETFGNISVSTTKALIENGRLVLRYELGDYWIEKSYNAENMNLNESVSNELSLQMEKDRIRWLKDLASMLLEEESEEENVDSLIQNYTI